MIKTDWKLKLLILVTSSAISLWLLHWAWDHFRTHRAMAVGSIDTPKAEIYGWALQPNAFYTSRHPDTGAPVLVRANSAGWRDVDHEIQKPPGVIRLLFIGDSVTAGSVRLEDLYTRKLEARLKVLGFNVEVISMGYGGWGTDQELEALIREGVHYKPDWVICQYTGNDLINNLSPYVGLAKKDLMWQKVFRYDLINGNLIRTGQPLPTEPTFEQGKEMLRTLFLKMKRVSQANGAQFLVYSFESYPYIPEVCSGVPVQYLIPSKRYQRFRIDSHANELGNLQMARDLANFFAPRLQKSDSSGS